MEPTTLAIAALTFVANGVASGAAGKLGEPLGEGVIESARRWLQQLQLHSPKTVSQLESVSDPNVVDVEVLEEVKRVAVEQPSVKAAMNDTVASIEGSSNKFPDLTKLAETVGAVNFGTIITQNNTFTF